MLKSIRMLFDRVSYMYVFMPGIMAAANEEAAYGEY
jgi:hypothetical protein